MRLAVRAELELSTLAAHHRAGARLQQTDEPTAVGVTTWITHYVGVGLSTWRGDTCLVAALERRTSIKVFVTDISKLSRALPCSLPLSRRCPFSAS